MKDYYSILECDYRASTDSLKKAYRRLSMYWHPDKNKSYNSKEKFIEITEAYKILTDENKRKLYDELYSEFLLKETSLSVKPVEYSQKKELFNQVVRQVRIEIELNLEKFLEGAFVNSFAFIYQYLWVIYLAAAAIGFYFWMNK